MPEENKQVKQELKEQPKPEPLPQLFFRYQSGSSTRVAIDGELLFDSIMSMMRSGSPEQIVINLSSLLYQQIMQASQVVPEVQDAKHN